jgi:hypothetical protein
VIDLALEGEACWRCPAQFTLLRTRAVLILFTLQREQGEQPLVEAGFLCLMSGTDGTAAMPHMPYGD